MVNGNGETSHAEVGRKLEVYQAFRATFKFCPSGYGVTEVWVWEQQKDEGSVLQFHDNAMINRGTFSLGPKSRQGEILSHQWL